MIKMSELRKTIEANNKRLCDLLRKGDAKALATLYTKDTILLPTESSVVKGNEAIRDFWAGAINGLKLKDANLKTVEVIGKGESVTEMGEYQFKMEQGDEKGKYVVVWKSTPEG